VSWRGEPLVGHKNVEKGAKQLVEVYKGSYDRDVQDATEVDHKVDFLK